MEIIESKVHIKIYPLNNVIKELHKEIEIYISNINNGGCGYFAYYFYSAVKPLFPQIKIIVYRNYFKQIDHIVVSIDDITIDGKYMMFTEDFEDTIFFSYKDEISEEELNKLLTTTKWNDLYDQRKNKLLEKIINNNLKNLESYGTISNC